jgi:thiol-disulfide isomerase/thioredoxin
MARTPSTMLALGTKAPAFSLPDTEGNLVASEGAAGRPLLVMFLSNHCPFVKHIRAELARVGRDYGRDVFIVGINSNDAVAYPDDSPAKMKEETRLAGYTFPYLFDETQGVAKAFAAACTPDFFLFDRAHSLVYRGQLDGSRPGNTVPVTGTELRAALDALLAGRAIPSEQKPSLGCNIKWKPGANPSYWPA